MINKSSDLANQLFPIQREIDLDVLNIPPNERKLSTETYDFTVFTINEYINDEHIKIPHFQRGYVWNRGQASRLIESLIIQCPIPVVFLSQNTDETLSVIDGNQRLTSINLFLQDMFPLSGLTTYPELNGFFFSDLDPRFQRHIKNRTIRCIVILKDTHPQIKFDVFERLNTGSVKLKPQEIRHGIYSGALMHLIDEIIDIKDYKKITSTINDKRMKAEEMVLRYFALRDNLGNYEKPMVTFLNNYAERNRNINNVEKEKFMYNFKENFEKCIALYGDFAYKTFDKTHKRLRTNIALYDCQMITIEKINPSINNIKNVDKEKLINELFELFDNKDFMNSITKATTDKNVIEKRLRIYQDFIAKFF